MANTGLDILINTDTECRLVQSEKTHNRGRMSRGNADEDLGDFMQKKGCTA